MKIFVLFGHTGEYSDRQEWLVKAFVSQTLAEEVRDRCNAYAKAAPDDWDEREKYEANNPDDPSMTMQYTGTEYRIEETELDEQVPA